MLDERRRQELIRRFDKLASQREIWIKKNRYYYEDQARYYRFFISEGLSVAELGCGTADLFHTLKPKRSVSDEFCGDSLRGWNGF